MDFVDVWKMYFAHKVGRRTSDLADNKTVKSHVSWLHFGMGFVMQGLQKRAENEESNFHRISQKSIYIYIYPIYGIPHGVPHSAWPVFSRAAVHIYTDVHLEFLEF